jgi:hypothetical protein
MTLTLLWKEVREQWVVVLSLAAAALGGVAALLTITGPGLNRDEFLIGLLCFAALGCGAVCGSLLMAGETEDGTQLFLDTLPGTRRQLWRVKAATGLGLLVAQMAAFAVVAFVCLQGVTVGRSAAIAVAGIFYCGGVGYAWGLYCGSFARNVLSAIGWALLLFALSCFLLVPFFVWLFAMFVGYNVDQHFWAIWPLAVGAVAVGAATRSRSLYCRVDLQRQTAVAPRQKGPVQPGWLSLFWLAWQQVRPFAVGMALLAALGTVAVAALGVAAWPFLTLLAGILCGITTFGDEQQSGAYRLLSDQRYPLGRVWFVKVAVRFATGFLAMALTALASAITIGVRAAFADRVQRQAFENSLGNAQFGPLSGLVTAPAQFLTIWFIYGYAVGLVFGQVFRKPLVAGVVAVGIAWPLVMLWAPSYIAGGGLHGSQVWGVPVVLVVASCCLMRPWAADRLVSSRSVGIVTGSALLALLWLVVALWYRAYEIPAVANPINVEEFKASLPTLEQNVAGREGVAALRQLLDVEKKFNAKVQAAQPQQPRRDQPPIQPTLFINYVSQAGEVVDRGWNPDDANLAGFLDEAFDSPWDRQLADAMEEPTGVLLDPRNMIFSTVLPELQAARTATSLLTVRSLQQQSEGNPAAFVSGLRTGLALGRNMRHKTILISVLVSAGVEEAPLRGVERWLERLPDQPDLLRRALEVLVLHDKEPLTGREEVMNAEFLVALETFTDPRNLPANESSFDLISPGRQLNVDLLRFAWQVPWEKVRLRRELEAIYSGDREAVERALKASPPLVRSTLGRPIDLLVYGDQFPRPRSQCRARAALLQVALRLYQAEKGRPAEKLTDLVPTYLASVPEDPYDGQPFRYRLSRGEVLTWPPSNLGDPLGADKFVGPAEPTRKVSAGQGILWSVGENRKDDGGRAQESSHRPGEVTGEDAIFLVPLPSRGGG